MTNNSRNDSDAQKDSYSVLIISHNRLEIVSIKKLLEASGYMVISCDNTEDAIDILSNNNIKTVLVNAGLPGITCNELLDSIYGSKPDIPVILTDLMSFFDIGMALHAVKKGIFDFTISSYDTEQLLMSVDRAVQQYTHMNEKNTVTHAWAENYYYQEYEGEPQAVLIKKKMAGNEQ